METFKYVRNGNIDDKNVFIGEYFSGPDVSIEIVDNVKKTSIEVESINFDVQEQLLPIYGYTSYTFDQVAVGQRIIVGEIVINMKNNNENIKIDLKQRRNNESFPETSHKPGWAVNNPNNVNHDLRNKDQDKDQDKDNSGSLIFNKEDSDRTPLDDSEQIKKIQEYLLDLTYSVTVNGYLDSLTKKAISDFQEKNNLKITGDITDELLEFVFGCDANSFVIEECYLYLTPSYSSLKLQTIKKGTYIEVISILGSHCYVKINNSLGYIEKSKIKMIQ